MANFDIAHKKTSVNEGGYTNDANDSGNYVDGKLIGTNLGISAPVLKAYLKRTPTVAEMKNLSPAVAAAIYKKNYWDVMKGDDWNSQDNANKVYDMCVNAGCGTAIKLWQSTIGVPQTGKMDKVTLDKTNHK
jgi:lysozyme family protein